MLKITTILLLILFIGCSQDKPEETVETGPVEYQLISHAGYDTLPASNVTILITDQTFSGQGPINRYFGKITDNRILPAIGTTMMAGPDHLMKYEPQYFSALDSAMVEGIGTNTLRITRNGNEILVFEKISSR